MADDYNTLTFYHNGSYLGASVEVPEELEKPKSLWQRLFSGKKKWKIIIGDQRYGDVLLQSPFGNKEQLFFRMHSGIELPISTSYGCNIACDGGVPVAPFSGWLTSLLTWKRSIQKRGDMIIPLNTPRYCDSECYADIERMHFLLNIMFRSSYLTLSFSDSDG